MENVFSPTADMLLYDCLEHYLLLVVILFQMVKIDNDQKSPVH